MSIKVPETSEGDYIEIHPHTAEEHINRVDGWPQQIDLSPAMSEWTALGNFLGQGSSY